MTTALRLSDTAPASRELSVLVPEELVQMLADLVAERVGRPPTQAESPWLDLAGACKHLHFSRDQLYKLTAARAIPFRKKQGGQGLRFHRDELDQWMETQYPRLDRLG